MLAIIITSHLQKQHCLKPFILLMLLNKLSKATCVALTVRSGLLFCFIAIMSKIKPVSAHYFNRFEFQGRGTLHMHLLVWLNNCKYIDYSNITATLPHVDDDALYNIVTTHLLLYSDKDFPNHLNKNILELTLGFIHETGRFQ